MRTFNEFQTQLTDEVIEKYPKEVIDTLYDYIENVPFIQRLISPDRKRAKDLPRDSEGRIIVDLSNPHILENMDYFRESAIHFKEFGCYTKLKVNTHPQSEYMKWFRREIKRCWEGMVRPEDGEWITGPMYFFLNYMVMVQTVEKITKKGKKIGNRIEALPECWEGIYWRFHYLDQCRDQGFHAAEIASRGKGKAHPYSQEVITPTGVKKWGDINIGDSLFGINGEITKVIDIPYDKETDIYKITLKDNRIVYSSINHLWNVYRRGVLRTMSLKNILLDFKSERVSNARNPKGVEYIYSIPRSKGVEFAYQSTPIDPYSMGLLLGDGTFRRSNKNCIYYTSTIEDMETYKKYIPYPIIKRSQKYTYSFNIDNSKDILVSFGLYMKKSKDKYIPEVYKYNTKQVRLNILKGLMDSDGSVDNNGVPIIALSSKKMIDDLAWIVRSLGYNCNYNIKSRGYKKNGIYKQCLDSYELRIYTNDKIFNLERKNNLLTTYPSVYSKSKRDSTRIVNIEFSHRELAKCVTVDNKSHSYLIGEFIQTHNSYSLASILAKTFTIGLDSPETSEGRKALIVADQKEYLIKDGTLNKFEDSIDFLSKHTQFPQTKDKDSLTTMTWICGWEDTEGNKKGPQNLVLGAAIGDNPDKTRGKRSDWMFGEEFGKFGKFSDWWDTSMPNVQEGELVFGLGYVVGTGGTEGNDFTGALNMINSPEANHIYGLPNIYDKGSNGSKHSIFFFPAYVNYKPYYNHDGVSDIIGAMLSEIAYRHHLKYSTDDPLKLTRRKAEFAFTIQDAIMRRDSTIYPVADLNDRINQIDGDSTSLKDMYVGRLELSGGEVKWKPDPELSPIMNWPHKDNKLKGCVYIKEMPVKDSNGVVPWGRYIGGCILPKNKVLTDRGLVNVEEVTFKDKLVNEEGKYVDIRRIIKLEQNSKPIYKIKTGVTCNTTTFTEEHPILISTTKNKYHNKNVAQKNGLKYAYKEFSPATFKRADEVKVGDWIKYPNRFKKEESINVDWTKYSHSQTYSDGRFYKNGSGHSIIDKSILKDPDFWWMVGLYLGDGWLSEYKIHFAINKKEENYINRLNSIANKINRATYSKLKGNCFEVSINSQTLVRFLKDNVEQYCNKKYIKDWIKVLPNTLKVALVSGYLDSDGCIWTQKKNSYIGEFVSINYRLLEDIQDILNSLEIGSTIKILRKAKSSWIINKYSSTQETYSLQLSHFELLKLKEYKSTSFKLGTIEERNVIRRDSKNYKFVDDFIYIKITDIQQSTYTGTVYNYECDTHTYLCDRITTHNCDPIDTDGADTLSLFSCWILDLWTDDLVAEYTGREDFVDDSFEICRRLLLFYNAECNYEKNKKGLFKHFSQHNCLHLLSDNLEFLAEKSSNKMLYGNNLKGTNASAPTKSYGRRCIRDYLLSPVTKDNGVDSEGNPIVSTIPKLFTIKFRALLQELSQWNADSNFDRHDALVMLMLLREDKLRRLGDSTFEGRYKENDTDYLGNDDFFTINYKETGEDKYLKQLKKLGIDIK